VAWQNNGENVNGENGEMKASMAMAASA